MKYKFILHSTGFLALLICNYNFVAAVPPNSQAKNELPLYGEVPKSVEEKAIDERFIADSIKISGTRDAAYEAIIKRGWEALDQRDLAVAMKRFNQASLLKPKEAGVFWGLAVTTAQQGDFKKSDELFNRGLLIAPNNARMRTDYGFMLVTYAIDLKNGNNALSEKQISLLERAEKEYNEALRLDPQSALPYSRLAVLEYYKGNFIAAASLVDESRKRGGEGLDPRFIKDLAIRNNR